MVSSVTSTSTRYGGCRRYCEPALLHHAMIGSLVANLSLFGAMRQEKRLINYASLGPPVPLQQPDPPAVRIQRCSVMSDLNAAGEAVVTMVISPVGTDAKSSFLFFAVHPGTAQVLRCVRLRDGTQANIPLHYAPGICLDLARSMVAQVHRPAPGHRYDRV